MIILGKVLAAIFMVLVTGLLLALPCSYIWNGALVPAVTGLKEVGVVQMWAIIVLSNIMFKPNAS